VPVIGGVPVGGGQTIPPGTGVQPDEGGGIACVPAGATCTATVVFNPSHCARTWIS
jgi:hypothetical protein